MIRRKTLTAGLALAGAAPLAWAADGEEAVDDVLTVIHRRKSVRKYTGEPVPEEKLMVLLRAAMAAPTGADLRPWRFVVVTERATMDTLAEKLDYTKMLHHAPLAIVVCGDTERSPNLWMLDCALASQNLLLAAEGIGLGAVYTAVWPVDSYVAHVSEVLGLPETVVPLTVIPVGYPAGENTPKKKFDPANIHRGTW